MKGRGVGGLLGVALCLATASAVAADAIVKPRLLDSVEASYPEGAHGDAQVELAVLIGEDGRVSEIDVRSGDEPFVGAAKAAVERWTFAPAMRDNVPVKARVLLKVSFAARPEPLPAAAEPTTVEAAAPPVTAVTEPPPAPAVQITVEGERAEDLAAIHIPRGDTRL
ncbi:MAG TPA: energy transducer TonB, partial [Polyangiaceae bacterium]|nr:energy transducer TonB [Polyangiaceae bacterium]